MNNLRPVENQLLHADLTAKLKHCLTQSRFAPYLEVDSEWHILAPGNYVEEVYEFPVKLNLSDETHLQTLASSMLKPVAKMICLAALRPEVQTGTLISTTSNDCSMIDATSGLTASKLDLIEQIFFDREVFEPLSAFCGTASEYGYLNSTYMKRPHLDTLVFLESLLPSSSGVRTCFVLKPKAIALSFNWVLEPDGIQPICRLGARLIDEKLMLKVKVVG